LQNVFLVFVRLSVFESGARNTTEGQINEDGQTGEISNAAY